MSGDSRAKEGVRCTINKKYKRVKSKQIGETERILRVELKMKENQMRMTTYGPNENETTCDNGNFQEKLNFEFKDATEK